MGVVMGASPAIAADRVLSPTATEPVPVSSVPVTPAWRTETIGRATLILGDCRDVLPTLALDRVVTDVPYGVAGGWGSGLRQSSARGAKSDYQAAFTDDPEYIRTVVAPAISYCASEARSVAVTTGLKNMWLYPPPRHVGSFQYPGSTVMSAWGPMLWQPILFYGSDPHQGRLRPDSRPNCNDVDRTTPHPCPKPLRQWQWLVERASLAGETVIDPFMGSGTTGVVCHALGGRDFIGIELDPTFFELACDRIDKAQRQGDLFVPAQVDTHPKGGDSLLGLGSGHD